MKGKGAYSWTGKQHKAKTKDKMSKSYVDIGDRNKLENARRRCIIPTLVKSVRNDGYSINETAKLIGCSVSSVKRYQKL